MEKSAPAKPKSVDQYLAAFPDDVRDKLEQLRGIIKAAAPHAEELISYNMPAYKHHGFLVSFAGWKKHIGLYPIPAGDEAFQQAIAAFKAEKSTLQLPYNKPLPTTLLTTLVKLRLKENESRAK